MSAQQSRKDRQAATRDRLIEVATDIVLQSGYHATSLDRIAEEAGFSKGAVYSNFRGKEELVLEVLDLRFENRLVALADALTAAPETAEERFEAFIDWWAELLVDEGWGVVIFEFIGSTRDNPVMRDEVMRRQVMVIDYCAQLLEAEIERFGLTPTMPARDLAAMMVSLAQGLSLTRSLDPTVPADILVDTAGLVLFAGPNGSVRDDGSHP